MNFPTGFFAGVLVGAGLIGLLVASQLIQIPKRKEKKHDKAKKG